VVEEDVGEGALDPEGDAVVGLDGEVTRGAGEQAAFDAATEEERAGFEVDPEDDVVAAGDVGAEEDAGCGCAEAAQAEGDAEVCGVAGEDADEDFAAVDLRVSGYDVATGQVEERVVEAHEWASVGMEVEFAGAGDAVRAVLAGEVSAEEDEAAGWGGGGLYAGAAISGEHVVLEFFEGAFGAGGDGEAECSKFSPVGGGVEEDGSAFMGEDMGGEHAREAVWREDGRLGPPFDEVRRDGGAYAGEAVGVTAAFSPRAEVCAVEAGVGVPCDGGVIGLGEFGVPGAGV